MSKFKISFLLFVFNLGFSQNESLKTEIWKPVPEKIDAYNFNKAPGKFMQRKFVISTQFCQKTHMSILPTLKALKLKQW